MTKLELINLNTKKTVLIKKKNNVFLIDSIEQWIALTKFTEAYLIIELPFLFRERNKTSISNEDIKNIRTPVDAKFVYHQEYELMNDLDFNWKPFYPLGNEKSNSKLYSKTENQFQIVPFSGNLNGNDHIIKNIHLIDTYNVGLFGSIFSGSIKNLILENIYIGSGNSIGCLAGLANNCILDNITIRGNIYLKGTDVSCLCSNFDGSITNVNIIVSGEIYGSRNRSLVINNFNGTMDKTNIISNVKIDCGYFNHLSGKLNNSNIISTFSIYSPFYKNTIYKSITNCYYLQLNNNQLPELQEINNSYYANLETINIASSSQFSEKLWIFNEQSQRYYLKNLINYTNGEKINRIKYYDWVNNETNLSINNVYISNNKEFVSELPITKIDINLINEINKQYISFTEKETELINKRLEKQNKNLKIKIEYIKSKLDKWNPLEPNFSDDKPELTITDDNEIIDEINLDIKMNLLNKNQEQINKSQIIDIDIDFSNDKE